MTDNGCLRVGQKAPDFTATAVVDQEFKEISLSQYKGKYVVLFFYPKAMTPGCTKQGCSLRDAWSQLQKQGVKVYGVSTDNESSQKQFKDEQSFPFALLADKDKAVTEAFGVKNLIGMASRSAFLFKDGVCVWVDPKGSTSDQAEQVLTFLKTQKH